MLKMKNSIIAVLLSAIVLVLCCACGNKNKDSGNTDNTSGASKPTYSIGSGSSVSSEESSSETGTTSKNTTSTNKGETYSEGNAVDLLDFDKPRDLYGETSITIIGDSISQGLNAVDLYDQSWASLFKKAVSKKFGANNMGYTSLCYNFIGSLYPTHEIHTVTVKAELGTSSAVGKLLQLPVILLMFLLRIQGGRICKFLLIAKKVELTAI